MLINSFSLRLTQPLIMTPAEPAKDVAFSEATMAVDRVAEAVLDKEGLLADGEVPVSIFGDGNCFYSSVSLALYGTQEVAEEIR